jgi:transposase
MNEIEQKIIIGIDVSKDTLDIWNASSSKEHQIITNTARAIGQWLHSVTERKTDIIVAFEPTGGYEKELICQLLKSEIKAYLIHPNHLHHYAKSLGASAKTDKIASKLLAQYLEEKEQTLSPIAPNLLENKVFSEIVHRRKQLIQMIHNEQCRLGHKYMNQQMKRSIKRILNSLKKELLLIEKELDEMLGKDVQKSQIMKLLCSFKGVGKVSSQTFVVDLPELGQLSRAQISKLVGVAPLNRDSGKKKGHRFIQGGRSHVRRILYMVALVAIRFNQPIKQYFEQLRARGKEFKVALVAAMRKIISILNAMVRDQKPWPVGGQT